MKNIQKINFKNVDHYISTFPNDIQKKLELIREVIQEIIPEANEVISYNMPAFKLSGKGVAYFSAYKNHIGFYPFPSGVEEFEKITNDYKKSGRGSIQFPHNKKLPLDLIKKFIKFRVKEIIKNKNTPVNPYMK